MTLLDPQLDALARLQAQEVVGTVAAVKGLALYVHDLPLGIGTASFFPTATRTT